MKRKNNGFWLKLLWGPPRKRLENHEKSNLCLWRGICAYEGENQFWLKLIGGPIWKRLKNRGKTTCLYEGEYAPMKGKGQGFWLKLMGGFPMKKGWKSRKIICLYERENLPMKGKVKVFTKNDRKSSSKKAGK